MNIYLINLNNIKYKQYKTYEDAYEDAKKLVNKFSDSKIEIKLEEYCEYGHSDSCCKLLDLFSYDNGIYK